MCKVMISIHPEYAEKIIAEQKGYEFRRVRPKRVPDTILLYVTAPISRVVAQISVTNILIDTLENLWQLTHCKAGLTKEVFTNYFTNKEIGVAYEIGDVTVFEEPKSLSEYGLLSAPQSFVYLD